MNSVYSVCRKLAVLAAVSFLIACKPGELYDYPNALVTKAPNIGGPFVAGTQFSLTPYGYQTDEFFFAGIANSYIDAAPLTSDGQWHVEPAASAEYKTRMLVHRPADPADFNGTVLVEWLNVTGGVDTAPDWIVLHTEILRQGYAWVGISAQQVGVEGGETPLPSPIGTTIPLKLLGPLRYHSLNHPGDSFSYDIFSQAARAIRHPLDIAPLGELNISQMIAVGESQSATRLITYINAFAPQDELFDGYFVHSRLGNLPDFGGASAPLSQSPQDYIPTNDIVRIREDLGRPVINLQSETDVLKLEAYPNRQPDSEHIRLWEVAGTAHADTYIITTGMFDEAEVSSAEIYVTRSANLFLPPCPEPISSAPQHHFVAKAALRALDIWLKDGIAPASAARLEVAANGADFVRDQFGIAQGGVRSPYVNVPIAVQSGDNQSAENESDICFLFGSTEWLDATIIDQLYVDQQDYAAKVALSAHDLVESRYLLAEDARLIIEAAASQRLTPFP